MTESRQKSIRILTNDLGATPKNTEPVKLGTVRLRLSGRHLKFSPSARDELLRIWPQSTGYATPSDLRELRACERAVSGIVTVVSLLARP